MVRSRAAIPTLLALVSLASALALLATLQYRWIMKIAEADSRRMHASLEFAANHFADDFDHDLLTRTWLEFAAPNPDGSPEVLARRYEEWRAATRDPQLIRTLYYVTPGTAVLQQLDLRSRTFVPAEWPAALLPVRDHLASMQPWMIERIPPIVPSVPALIVRCGAAPVMIRADERDAPVHMRRMMIHSAGGVLADSMMCPAFAIVVLDRDHLVHKVFPDLTQRYFGNRSGGDYEIAIGRPAAGEVIYRSASWPQGKDFRGDISIPIFRLRIARMMERGMPAAEPGGEFRLAVRYHGGSLADAVRSAHRRNVGVALAILAVLAGSVATLVVMLRRAQRLQQQQLEFVAGITHELNTPLAALTAAGQNLADGIVPPEQTAQYGGIVVKEARRLSDMVAEVLDYAGMEAGRQTLRTDDVDVCAIVADAIQQCRWMAEGKSIRIDEQIAAGLPHVSGDAAALTRAVQNLIANAIRHGGDGGWVRVEVTAEKNSIAVIVEDGGRGIPASEIPHLFEPFFRGSAAAQVRGSGLGLTIVDRVARAHGGSVSVDAGRRRGASFTLRLPLRPATSTAGEMASQNA